VIWLSRILGTLYFLLGTATTWQLFGSILKYITGRPLWSTLSDKEDGRLILFSFITSVLHALRIKPLITSNVNARANVHHIHRVVKLNSFKTGVILFAGLVAYDVFFVFGTTLLFRKDIMSEVACEMVKIDAPVALMVESSSHGTMLGIGDVAIPGMFIALAMRYDQYMYFSRGGRSNKFPKSFFWASIIAYVVGLVLASFVASHFNNPQPALLYICPACTLALIFTGLWRGELSAAWAWSTAQEKLIEITDTEEKLLAPFPNPGDATDATKAVAGAVANGGAKND